MRDVDPMTRLFCALRERADSDDPQSLGNRMRGRRFRLFDALAARLAPPVRILDIGGTNAFWERRGWAGRDDVQITLANLEEEPRRHANIRPTVGDATGLLAYADGSFDIAFSNSVIEHLYTAAAQAAMAREVRRVAPAYWVQTPSFWFPIEPHFLVPAWHWLPVPARIAIIRRRACGWRGPCASADEARRTVTEIRLLRRRELRRLFPDATIAVERFRGLTKSYVAYGGFPPAPPSPRTTRASGRRTSRRR